MATQDCGFGDALEQVKTALAAMGSGDPEPYIDCWPESDDVTLFGAWGPIEKGHRQLTETFRWVGSRFKRGQPVPEHSVVFASGDLAYTVGFERGEVAVDDGPARPMTIRVTHIYRRIAGAWRLVHRHADFPLRTSGRARFRLIVESRRSKVQRGRTFDLGLSTFDHALSIPGSHRGRRRPLRVVGTNGREL
jgi:ketosteroid isomerase-like protein